MARRKIIAYARLKSRSRNTTTNRYICQVWTRRAIRKWDADPSFQTTHETKEEAEAETKSQETENNAAVQENQGAEAVQEQHNYGRHHTTILSGARLKRQH